MSGQGTNTLPPLAAVGREIAKGRKAARLSTRRVAQITRIPERYVRCIEAGDFASLPGKTFVFGFTRTICVLLELDADRLIRVIRAEMYASCADEPGLPPAGFSPGAVLRRISMRQRA
ncbi:MAG: helix-turn-helix domain-containing protein [Erythrobacter sp.]